MDQSKSPEELNDEYNRFKEKINESNSLPLYLCFMLQITDPNGDAKRAIHHRLLNVVKLLEEKLISETNRNHFAFLLNDSNQLYRVDFCNSDQFTDSINNLLPSIYHQNNDDRRNKIDLYEKSFTDLTWKKSIKILVNLNLSNAEEIKESRDRLINNFLVEVFDMKSIQHFESFFSLFDNLAAKRVEIEKLTPQYKPTKDYKYTQFVSYFGHEEVFDKDKIPLNRDFLSSIDKSIINELKKQTKPIERYFHIEDVPFTNGVEMFCFMGYYTNSNNQRVQKVFKLAKYKENDLRENFLAQVIAQQLANEFSMLLL